MKRLYFAIAGICLFLSSMRVWTVEHNKCTPQFTGEIENVEFGFADMSIPPGKELRSNLPGEDIVNNSIAVVAMSLINRGTPSVAYDYRFILTMPNGQEYVGKKLSIPQAKIRVPDFGLVQGLGVNDFLDSKTAISPITTGGRQIGVLLFTVDTEVRHLDDVKGGKIEVTFLDSWNVRQSIVMPIEARKFGLINYPGLPFREAPKDESNVN
jgi:hypothetical protein